MPRLLPILSVATAVGLYGCANTNSNLKETAQNASVITAVSPLVGSYAVGVAGGASIDYAQMSSVTSGSFDTMLVPVLTLDELEEIAAGYHMYSAVTTPALFYYMGSKDGWHYLRHNTFLELRNPLYRISEDELSLPAPFPFTMNRDKWRPYNPDPYKDLRNIGFIVTEQGLEPLQFDDEPVRAIITMGDMEIEDILPEDARALPELINLQAPQHYRISEDGNIRFHIKAED